MTYNNDTNISAREIEDLLRDASRRLSINANNSKDDGILSELSYNFEGIGWNLQPLNEDPPMEIGINGIKGKHTFYEVSYSFILLISAVDYYITYIGNSLT